MQDVNELLEISHLRDVLFLLLLVLKPILQLLMPMLLLLASKAARGLALVDKCVL